MKISGLFFFRGWFWGEKKYWFSWILKITGVLPFMSWSLLSFLYIGDFHPLNSVSRLVTWSVTQYYPIPLQLTAQLDHSSFLRLTSAATLFFFFPSAIFLTPGRIHYNSVSVLYDYVVQSLLAKEQNSDKESTANVHH